MKRIVRTTKGALLLLCHGWFASIMAVTLPGGQSECGFPGLPRNGTLTGSGILYHPGEEVTYQCQTGFVMFGPNKRTCMENGTWTPVLPECRENLALNKSALQSATLWTYEPELAVDSLTSSCSFTPRSSETRWWQVHLGKSHVIESVAITISPGSYQRFTIFVIELMEGNKAMYKPCSKFDGEFAEEKAIFLCNDGEGFSGQFVYLRDDREELEYFGICEVEVFQVQEKRLCGDPEQPVSTVVSHVNDTSVNYSCLKGYRMIGNPSSHCNTSTGRWAGSAPRCIEVQCDHPSSVKDGFIEVSNFKGKYVFGSLATYHCNPGYILWGNASRLCSEEGEWTGYSPTCKPITCGQPPKVHNARFNLVNGSTSWQSITHYICKPGFKMIYENKNVTHVSSFCSENGIWNPVSFACVYDPVGSLNLKKARSLGEWANMGLGFTSNDGSVNVGTIAIISVLSILIILVIIVVVIFFTHRRSEEEASRKVSRSSTNQLIADAVAAASVVQNNGDQSNGTGGSSNGESKAPSSSGDDIDGPIHFRGPFEDTKMNGNVSTLLFSPGHNKPSSSMSTFRPHQNSPLPILPSSSQHLHHSRDVSGGSSSIGGRSAGDGGSVVDEANYATLLQENIADNDNESSHYTLIRKPDGRADEPNYSTLSRKSSTQTRGPQPDDPGYESLNHQRSRNGQKLRSDPTYVSLGIDAPEVREQVYETLRKNSSGYESMQRSISSGTTGSATSQSTVIKNSSENNSPIPHIPQDLMALYARVDPSKKKKNRESGSSLDSLTSEIKSSLTSPPPSSSSSSTKGGGLSPTKSLIQKFNSIGTGEPSLSHKNIIRLSSQNSLNSMNYNNINSPNHIYERSPSMDNNRRYATVDRASRLNSSNSKNSSRLFLNLKSADV
ncbi:uncharacterized protein [Lepeophtheirus salmonis]|uniref:uncharacterized protein isoform X1 n=1 Tax=Lepeophtheirus salmonis TaxID=72036 RepID=UPI003AF4036C